MRFTLLTPGTGHFYCGSCLRDQALARALQRLGHDVEVVPLYLPLVLEEHAAPAAPVLMGGINVYLQHRSRLARHMPRFLANLLDRPALLRWASRRGTMTEAPDLGSLTLSMLRGESGRQAREVDRLVEWLRSRPRPDVVVISNAMLCGVVRRLKAALGVPVVATLQGEAPFLDALPEPYAEQSWSELRVRIAEVDALAAVSASYAERMAERLWVDVALVRVIHNGIELEGFAPASVPASARRPRTIGYLARMCRDKGLDTLVDAFLALTTRGSVPDLRLRIAGVQLAEDRSFVAALAAKVAAHGRGDDVEFLPNIDRADKLAFLGTLSVLSVPARYGEAFGLYLLEAMAAGVPVVQPRHAAFPEILAATGGGLLCAADDVLSLADRLETVLTDEALAAELAAQGRRSVAERFTAERMASDFVALCRELTA
ncbi:MAG: glycosyltransferase family 4 protein [Planctomycetes bacterium]|nr:glycosyltransferase family 4 protein [Planctomycetota bacterium]